MPRSAPKNLVRAAHDIARVYAVAFIVSCVLLFFVPSWLRWCFFYSCGLLFLTSFLGPIVNDWKPRSRVPTGGKAVFISGCDSGFGFQLAQRLDDKGLHVFAGCLFPDGDGANKLKKSASSRLHIVSLDVTSDESIAKARTYVDEHIKDNKLWAVVNNAGMNDGGHIFWTRADIIERIMEVNTIGVVKVTKAFLTLLVPSKGRVVSMASAAGRNSYFGLVPYCMSKAAIISFCDGLRQEMYQFGVKVVTIEPWMYRTAINDEDIVMRYVRRTWDQAPDDVKAFFPENYAEKSAKLANKILNFSVSDNPQEVVDCMEEAVLTLDPKYVYNPGTFYARYTDYILKRMPKEISDFLVTTELSS